MLTVCHVGEPVRQPSPLKTTVEALHSRSLRQIVRPGFAVRIQALAVYTPPATVFETLFGSSSMENAVACPRKLTRAA
jgi:hypothetical protein